MNQLYKSLRISKQAVHQHCLRQLVYDTQTIELIRQADELRREHPGCGVEKMYYVLKPAFMGRDKFIELFMDLGYRIKRQRNYRRTTIAHPTYYPNLIKGLQVNKPSVVWQSDITYIQVGERFYYAVFIIDVYTKKIVGYNVSDHMRATANTAAFKMALKHDSAPDIHHSDRGSQYNYKGYIKLLNENNSKISMALSAQDNAYAERINRTIKEEYLKYWNPKTFEELKKMTCKAVVHYNSERPHRNLNMMSPINYHKNWSTLKDNQRPKITIFDNEQIT